jgi:hypothetical protein
LRIIRDAVENRLGVNSLGGRQKSSEINPGDHMTILRRNSRDPVRVPDIGVNFAFDKFEFVELIDNFASVFDSYMTVSWKDWDRESVGCRCRRW